MANRRREKDPEAQAIIEAGSESVEWVRQEFACADLSDKRLDRRLMKTAQHLARSPASPINEACGNLGEHAGGVSAVRQSEGCTCGHYRAAYPGDR